MPLSTILVEDSKTIQETLIPALEELADAQVVAVAATASDAIEALAEWREDWQLAVVDLFLQEGSGMDVLEALQQRKGLWARQPPSRQGHPGQQVYVLSNYATADMRRQCKALGADGVFDKSTELEAFFERCSELPHAARRALHADRGGAGL
ncbi:response regulator [Acidovorax sp. LjRoot117]|uniref:response regulator n=1 Tax=Acidovorax sp. LjRoot117 TaxID=3342255 RepID=UPI003ECD1DE3